MKSDKIKQYLIKEASRRVEQAKQNHVPMDNMELKQWFLHESVDRLSRLQKLGMAFNTGYSNLNTAVWNLAWDYPDVGPKAAAIKKDIEENFHPYMKEKVRERDELGKLHQPFLPTKGGLYRYQAPDLESNDPDKLPDEPLATLVMRFKYRRHIKPMFNKKSLGIADDAINQVSQAIGFDINAFISDLEDNSISLNPYYHASVLSEEKGGSINKDDLTRFIRGELQRYSSIQSDDHLSGVDSSAFYQDHYRKYINYGGDIQLNRQRQSGGMKFDNNEIGDLNYDSYLMRAIANKVRQGYALDVPGLYKEIDRQLQINSYVAKMTPEEYRQAASAGSQQIKHIMVEFDKGLRTAEKSLTPEKILVLQNLVAKLQSVSGTERSKLMERIAKLATPGEGESFLHWGIQSSKGKIKYRVGLEVTEGEKSQTRTTLDTTDLKLLLSLLTLDSFEYFRDNKEYTDDHLKQFNTNYSTWATHEQDKYHVGRNEFYVPKFSVYFSSNGLDSDPGTLQRMPVIPMLRKLPAWEDNKGEVLYDRDTINLGRNHLVKNWNKLAVDNSAGRPRRVQQPALGAVVEKWGQASSEAIRKLASLQGKTPFGGNDSDPSVADIAWYTVMHNRTGAETVYESLIKKYGDNYSALSKDVLDRSLASALETYYEHNPKLEDNEQNSALFRLFANGLPSGDDPEAWKRMAEQIKSTCRTMPGQHPCKVISMQYPETKKEFEVVNRVYEIAENNLPTNPLVGAIQEYKKTGNWDRMSKFINNYHDSVMATDQDTRIDPQGWKSFSQYGYGLSKMMDFVSCLMHTSCGEKIPGVARGLNAPGEDEIFGRHYSTSSGKGDGGQIMVGLYYAFNAEEVSADPDDPSLTEEQREEAKIVRGMLNSERTRRHDAYGIRKGHNTYRKSSYWERMQDRTAIYKGEEVVMSEHKPLPYGAPQEEIQEESLRQAYEMNRTGVKVRTIKVIETLNYFIGEAGSTEGMLKKLVEDNKWKSILSELERRFPTLQKQLNMLIMPVNARFDLIELSAKRAIDAVRKKLEQEPPPELAGKPSAMKTTFEIIMKQADGSTSVLSTDQLDSDASNLEKFIGNIKENNPNEDIEMPGEAGDIRAPEPGMGDEVEAPGSILPATERIEDSTGAPLPPQPPADIEVPQPEGLSQTPGAEGIPVTPQYSVPTPVPSPLPPTPEEKKVPKPMPGNNTLYVGKDKSKRQLFRNPSHGSSVVDRLEKVANELDKRGIQVLADKVDLLLWKLRNAKENS